MTNDRGRSMEADVLVIGAGAAGLMAARAASDAGASVILADKSVIGRGGATVMAQMTVAVALGDAEPDSAEIHAVDTLSGSRGLADPTIVRMITEAAPKAILEVERYGTDWAKEADGRHKQVVAPGHSRRRCVYVDMLKTGENLAAALRRATRRDPSIKRLQNTMITDLILSDGRITGAMGMTLAELEPLRITTPSVIIATGGLTKLFARSSASANMTGDGLWLAAEAGAVLRDLEMVQFFPIAHLHPPLVHLDPIMWDPFRYKLGGRLLNGDGAEFMDTYAQEVAGTYSATRDVTTRAIFEEVRAGRGSPHGGAYLDFRSTPPDELATAFGPVVAILRDQGVDLTRDLVEVAPMAHFLLGGIQVDTEMESTVPGLFACGEAIHGMHGANRLSGNAVTEAIVTGRIAGRSAAARRTDRADSVAVEREARVMWSRLIQFWHPRPVAMDDVPIGAMTRRMRQVAWEDIGPLRTDTGLRRASDRLQAMRAALAEVALAPELRFPMALQEKLELRTMIDLAAAIAAGALVRTESRGAHTRLDMPETWEQAKTLEYRRADGDWTVSQQPGPPQP